MKYSIVEMEMKADVRLQAMIRRGDIFMAVLPKGIGCEQGGRRPVVVIQNNIGNFRSPLVIVASVTGARKKPMPTHVPLGRAQGLSRPSLLLLESIYTIESDSPAKRPCFSHRGRKRAYLASVSMQRTVD